jgi:hypothetical protein
VVRSSTCQRSRALLLPGVDEEAGPDRLPGGFPRRLATRGVISMTTATTLGPKLNRLSHRNAPQRRFSLPAGWSLSLWFRIWGFQVSSCLDACPRCRFPCFSRADVPPQADAS